MKTAFGPPLTAEEAEFFDQYIWSETVESDYPNATKGVTRLSQDETEGREALNKKIVTLHPPIIDPRTAPSVKPFRVALLTLLNGFDDSIIGFDFDCDDAGKIVRIDIQREKAG